jgi:hypothetical protein
MSSAASVVLGSGQSKKGRKSGLELIAVFLLGIGSVATAWCGFQASQWNGREAKDSRDAGLARTEASQLSAIGTQMFAYDANIAIAFAGAYTANDTVQMQFLRTALVRPDFLPVLETWRTAVENGGSDVVNLFDNQDYLDSLFSKSKAATDRAEAALADSDKASEYGDAYLLTTLLTAMALFFAGVTTSFNARSSRMMLLALSIVALAFTAVRVLDLPIA